MKIAGIVLAGGLSTRMGQDKATLTLEGRPLLEQTVEMLAACNLDKVFVSGDYKGFNSILDRHQLLGPIGGLDACVAKLFGQFDALFVMPVDMPLLTSCECLFLIEKYKSHPQGVFYSQAMFPIILPLSDLLKEYLTKVLISPHNKQRSLFRLIKTLKLQSINAPPEKLFRFKNSNTQQQWNDCLKDHQQLKMLNKPN